MIRKQGRDAGQRAKTAGGFPEMGRHESEIGNCEEQRQDGAGDQGGDPALPPGKKEQQPAGRANALQTEKI